MTKTAQHSLIFKSWIRIRGLLAIIIVLFGIIVGLISLILPNEALYKQYIVDFLSQQWHKQVSIETISGKWQGFGPKFIIQGLRIKDKDEVLVQQATLNINVMKYLIPKGATGISLGINNMAVDFERKQSGKIVFKEGKKNKENFSNEIGKLLATGNLSVDNLTFNFHDAKSNKNKQVKSSIVVQQSNNERAFSLKLDSPEIADNIIIKGIADKSNDFLQQAKWYVEADNLSLQNLGNLVNKDYLPKAFIQAQMWFSTNKGNVIDLIAQAELKNKLFNTDAEITGHAELVYRGINKNHWDAELSIKDLETQLISQQNITVQLSRNKNFITIDADVLDIPLLKTLMHALGISNDSLDTLNVTGKLTDVMIKYDVQLRRIIVANIHFQKLDLIANLGAFKSLAGSISLKDEQIRLLIDADTGSAQLPAYIRGTVTWNKLLLTAQASMQDDDLDVKINSLWCDCQDYVLDGAARITYDKRMMLDLTVAVYNAQVNQLYKYWPSFKWKPKILNFLDQALVFGVVDRGMIIYHGQPTDFPFVKQQGMFLTKAHLTNATVKYHEDWPIVDNFSAIVDTTNLSLNIKSSRGNVMDANIKTVTASIHDIKDPLLNVNVLANGKDNYLIDFLKQSPMKEGLKVLDQDIVLSGYQETKVALQIPLKLPDVKVEPVGSINFKDTDFQIGQFQLQKLNGGIDFTGFSLILNKLDAVFLNQKVVVTGDIINEPEKPVAMHVLINGNYDVENFEPIIGTALPAKGQSPWQFSISNEASEEVYFTAKSDLVGVELTMPEPFAKPVDSIAPFSITCTLPCIESGWNLKYDNKLISNFNLNSDNNELKLNTLIFGEKIQDFNFGGEIDVVDVDEWITIIANGKIENNSNSLPFRNMSVTIGEVKFMSRVLKSVAVEIINSDTGLTFNVDAEDVKGSIQIAKDLDNKGIIVKLDKLHWQEPELQVGEQNISQVSESYPALHVWIGDFIYDGIPLGESSIEVRSINEGIKVEKFVTKSDLLSLNINGVWLKGANKNGLSKFNIIMTSKDIAQFLVKLGFQAPISQAETIIDMQAQWNDLPSQFEIKNVNGTMQIQVGKGEVIDAKPGMGRVLGLFSLTNLPRRLILDFRDVFGKGLQFQSMQGDFELKNGEAITDSFVIDSSSAQIVISGKTGLANQDYDQTVIVVPRVGRVLPTIGALTGGAVGAAAGFFVQGMFHRGLKDVGKITYKVTGYWDNPIIELIKTEDINNE